MLDRSAVARQGAESYAYGLPAERFHAIPSAYERPASDIGYDAEERFNPLRLLIYVIQYRWLIATLLIVGAVTGFPLQYVTGLQQCGSLGSEASCTRTTASAAGLTDRRLCKTWDFIGDPFGSKPSDWIDRLFSTHPPIADRVRALLGQEQAAASEA